MIDYFEILGVKREAVKQEIKNAYYKLAMKLHPDHLAPPLRKSFLSKFLRVTRAYRVLIDDEKKRDYLQELAMGTFMEDRERERKEARDKMFNEGIELLKKDPHRSVKYFKTAYSFERNNQGYKSYYGLSLILSDRETQGIKLCREALEKETNATNYFNLACGFAKIGKYRKTINYLKKTLQLDKNHREALDMLEKLQQKVGVKGLFRRG
ncbi:DnaJ domain-containing protein [candidate division WOR-3 bacterium]|nr:DnaJ domain-containing protein [candidate division WOR-3 bacterium]